MKLVIYIYIFFYSVLFLSPNSVSSILNNWNSFFFFLSPFYANFTI